MAKVAVLLFLYSSRLAYLCCPFSKWSFENKGTVFHSRNFVFIFGKTASQLIPYKIVSRLQPQEHHNSQDFPFRSRPQLHRYVSRYRENLSTLSCSFCVLNVLKRACDFQPF